MSSPRVPPGWTHDRIDLPGLAKETGFQPYRQNRYMELAWSGQGGDVGRQLAYAGRLFWFISAPAGGRLPATAPPDVYERVRFFRPRYAWPAPP